MPMPKCEIGDAYLNEEKCSYDAILGQGQVHLVYAGAFVSDIFGLSLSSFLHCEDGSFIIGYD